MYFLYIMAKTVRTMHDRFAVGAASAVGAVRTKHSPRDVTRLLIGPGSHH